MSWSGRSLRARIAEIRTEGVDWEPAPEPFATPDRSLDELVRGFRRGRRGSAESDDRPATPSPENRAIDDVARPKARTAWPGSSDVEGGPTGWRDASLGVARGASPTATSSATSIERREDLWVLEESIDPAAVAADHFAPDFGIEMYRLGRTPSGAPLPPRERLIYFDLETTGLASHDLLFMSGCLYFEGDRLVLRQVVAEDVAEERALVDDVRRRIEERGVVVTYNGRSFDLPALDRRLAFHGLPKLDRERLEVHDLLHLARRRFRGELPDCKLSTLEREIICKQREGQDVPGMEVPLRFLDFQETGDLAHLDPVLYHNRIDLTTMVALLPRLIEGDPESGA